MKMTDRKRPQRTVQRPCDSERYKSFSTKADTVVIFDSENTEAWIESDIVADVRIDEGKLYKEVIK